MTQAIYLFCLAQLCRLPSPCLMGKGLDSQSPLEVVGYHDLAAVISPVPLEDFCGSEAEARMQDLTWIGPRVIRHQEVAAEVMRHSPVLPARFGTIFSSLETLTQVLRRHHDTIAGFLARIADQEEWAVKGMLDQAGAKEKLFTLSLVRESKRLEALSPGMRYFDEQRLRTACDLELQHWLKEVCRELWADLQNYAADVRERRLLSRKASGSDKDMVWNWAFMVPKTAVPAFLARIRTASARYADHGLNVEFTGPWPPYSFTPALNLEPET
jgi:hypothetical protein